MSPTIPCILSTPSGAQVFSRRAVGADIFVGEVNVPVAYLDDTLPRYQWLTMQKRTEKDRVTGDLRLRLHWRSDVVATDEDQGHVLEVGRPSAVGSLTPRHDFIKILHLVA